MSRTCPQQGDFRYRPLTQFNATQLDQWKYRYRQHRMFRGCSEPPYVRSRIENLAGAWTRKHGIKLHNDRVARKTKTYQERLDAGLQVSPVRIQPFDVERRTYNCKVIGCWTPASLIFTGLHLCDEHLAQVKQYLTQ